MILEVFAISAVDNDHKPCDYILLPGGFRYKKIQPEPQINDQRWNGKNEVWLRGLISYIGIILTGPIIVACQWNTETNKGILESLTNVGTCIINCSKMLAIKQSLQSSPTGPAEQWAGGSRCRSLNSWSETKYLRLILFPVKQNNNPWRHKLSTSLYNQFRHLVQFKI